MEYVASRYIVCINKLIAPSLKYYSEHKTGYIYLYDLYRMPFIHTFWNVMYADNNTHNIVYILKIIYFLLYCFSNID